MLSFLLFLIVAAICAIIASALVPGRIPGGFLVAMVCGFIGAWIGGNLMGSWGPELAGVSLIPTIIGSALLVMIMGLFSGLTHEPVV